MCSNKYTSRGFGASGASRSSWTAPRESYKVPHDKGSSFLFGGAGLRGSPKSGAQHRSIPSGPGSPSSAASRTLTQGDALETSDEHTKRARGIDLSGGDITTTKFERSVLFLGLLIAAIVFSMVVRACASASDSSWVQEHRAHINPDD